MRFLRRLSSPPKQRVNFIYKLAGEPQEIDVFELAPTLLALGQLIQESNRTLYPEGQQIAVNVKPFQGGSFIVDIVLFPGVDPHTLWSIAESAAQNVSTQQILTVLGTLGIISTAADKVAKAGSSVLKVIRELRGKPTEVKPELEPGEYRYTSDNNSISVTGPVHKLLQNPTITNNIYLTFGKPLERENVEDVESYLANDETTKVVVTKEDAPALKEFAAPGAFQSEQEKDDTRIVSGVYLNPRRGAYSGDGKQWSFHRGKNTITANVKDERFLKKVQSGEIRPHYTDLMTVTLAEKQKVTGTKVSVSYEILSVDDYEFGGKQQQLTDRIEVTTIKAAEEPKALLPGPDESERE